MSTRNIPKLLRRAVALLMAVCVLASPSLVRAYAADEAVHSITVSAVPGSINGGMIDPIINLYANEPFTPELINSIRVDTGTTGLTMDGIEVSTTSNNQLVVRLYGTAQEGSITIMLEGDVWAGDDVVIPVLPAGIGDDSYVVDPIKVSVEPETINAGTVDPVIYVSSNAAFNPKSVEYIIVETGTTGLTKANIEVSGETRLAVRLRGTAQAGTVTIKLDSIAFLKGSNEIFTLDVEVLPAEGHTYAVMFVANNGTNQTIYANVEADELYRLPECMFDAAAGQKFKAWLIDGHEYLPGDPYAFTKASVVEAVWEAEKKGNEDKVDYEKRTDDAIDLIKDYVSKMTDEEKDDPTAIDLATLYAEAVIADAISIQAGKSPIHIAKATVSGLTPWADKAVKRAEDTLIQGGVTPHRYLSATITLDTQDTSIEIQIAPDLPESDADKVRVRTPGYALTFRSADLAPDLTNTLTVKAAPAQIETLALTDALDIEISNGGTTNPITVSLPTDSSKDTTYQAMVNKSDTAVTSKYNPATKQVDGKINTSGTYYEKKNEVDFTDIANKSAEMKAAIKYLASHGISMGTSATTFSPDDTISREQLTTLVVRALGKVDSRATTGFTDVAKGSTYYAAVASGQRLGYISGFEDNTFRGRLTINKEQIVVIAGRVLTNEMRYKTLDNSTVAKVLSKYSDTVVSWARPQVALATRENLVVYRADGTFSGARNMTRGDAAIIISRLFQKIW